MLVTRRLFIVKNQTRSAEVRETYYANTHLYKLNILSCLFLLFFLFDTHITNI